MKTSEQNKIAVFRNLWFGNYLTALTIKNQFGPQQEVEQQLTLMMSKDAESGAGKQQVEFHRVRMLRFHQPSDSIIPISCLMILPAEDSHLSFGKYRVFDPEPENVISFYCSDFSYSGE